MNQILSLLGLKSYETDILKALEENNETLVKKLCSEAQKNKKNDNIALALCRCLESYSSEKNDPQKKETIEKRILLLLDSGGDFLNNFVNTGEVMTTPLICAVLTWEVEKVKLLLDRGANVLKTYHNHQPVNSALDEACECRNLEKEKKAQRLEIIKLLLEKGADVNGSLYESPLQRSMCLNLDDDIIEIMKLLMGNEKYKLYNADEKKLNRILNRESNVKYKNIVLEMIEKVKLRKKVDGRRSSKRKDGGMKSRSKNNKIIRKSLVKKKRRGVKSRRNKPLL